MSGSPALAAPGSAWGTAAPTRGLSAQAVSASGRMTLTAILRAFIGQEWLASGLKAKSRR
jgi:hypothetical protein